MDINNIAARVINREPVTDQERAFLVRNNPYALAAFMIDNNPGSVNLTLRNLGYNHLGFEPDKKALTRQLTILLERGNDQDFDAVFRNFVAGPEGLSQEYYNELIKQFSN